MTLDELQKEADRLAAEHSHAQRRVQEEDEAVGLARSRLADLEEAQRIILQISQEIQSRVHARVALIVSKCLRAVFHDPYSFEIIFERKRGRTEARFVFKKRGREVDPLSEGGGGVVDVAAFALRMACLVLTKPAPRRLIVADEPMKYLNGEEYQQRAAAVIQALTEEMGVQLILAADDDWLKIGKVVEL
jgi:hypothetical protein